MITISLIVFSIVIFLLPASYLYAGLRAVSWLPTRGRDIQRIMILANLRPGQVFYDLGCGDGRLLFAAARSGATANGFEISILQFFHTLVSSLRIRRAIRPRLYFRDFWSARLLDADVVFFYLIPRIMPRLLLKLEKELKNGTKVISYRWPIPGWEPKKIDTQSGEYKIYYYER